MNNKNLLGAITKIQWAVANRFKLGHMNTYYFSQTSKFKVVEDPK